ncbi:Secretory carrier-associated membrane protein isoform 4 [Schistosoma japonicum]|uniref:Secretory carrier-associated membrane protein n=1 Tax=Schistosoma japonicum TaxID=6182 RepID=C1LED4_SCHJA|nr:Secretory carrier-associated membrane protein 1 [Schistosoma japonicum]TNN05745.1 Secretory carrier-associated membrane protein isoform 4 [Schistosoma japonicum]CAX73062.1 Secretory carrier-associated membrane protein 2 [Schistosoma japonicum]
MSKVNQDSLEDYNPFTDPAPRYETLTSASNESSQDNRSKSNVFDIPPPPLPSMEVYPPFAKASSGIGNESVLALERRQAELEARAAELDRREKEQQARMNAIHSAPSPHNWPPFPAFCPCKPCVRQDFENDIPFDCRWMAKMGYGIWLGYAVLLMFNMGGALGYFIVGTGAAEGPLFGASILLMLAMPPVSFFGWHRPLYKALRSDSSANYLIFFLFFSGQTIIILIQCLGIDYLGSCGWINGIKTLHHSDGVGVLMLLIATLFSILAGFCCLLLFKVHRHYRTSGASLQKAKLEMTNAGVFERSGGFGAMP